MSEAVKAFKKIKHNSKLFILGDMLELGKRIFDRTSNIIDILRQDNQNVILVGQIQ